MRRNLNPFNPADTIFVSPAGADYKTITEALAVAGSGKTIVVYPGTYNEQVILKNGVDIHCIGGVTISSSSTGGTITDNNVALTASLKGNPVITNTNGYHKDIVLSNAASVLNGDYLSHYEYIAQFNIGPAVSQYKLIKNTFPIPFNTPVKNSTGSYRLQMTNPGDLYYLDKAYTNAHINLSNDDVNNIRSIYFFYSDTLDFFLKTYDSSGALADFAAGSSFIVTVHAIVPRTSFKQ